jgi:hypothetical protein
LPREFAAGLWLEAGGNVTSKENGVVAMRHPESSQLGRFAPARLCVKIRACRLT